MSTSPEYTATASSSLVSTYRVCAWCGERIVGIYFERHHWLIKRGRLPKSRFAELDVLLNVVPLHHNCHQQHGQTVEMRRRCYQLVTRRFGEEAVKTWYAQFNLGEISDECCQRDAEE